MTDCERTTLYLDNELPAGEEAAALAHLATCAQCQADVDDWVAMETMLSRPGSGGARASIARGPAPAAADVVALRPRRAWRTAAIALAAAVFAVVVLGLIWRGRAASGDEPVLALAEARPLAERLTAPAFDRYRPYRVGRDVPAHEVVPLQVVAAFERRQARAELAAAHVLSGDLSRASAVLEASPASAARDSDRAAVALASDDPARALQLADAAIAAERDLAPAHWNRALALQALDLPLAAAAEFDAVIARGELGWAVEARERGDGLRAPLAARNRDFAAFRASVTAMLDGGAPLDHDAVEHHPGPARVALLDALAIAGSPDEARRLLPLAVELDRKAGGDRAARAVAAVAARDFAVRTRFSSRYRAMLAGSLGDAERRALIAELDAAGEPVVDLLIGALLQAPPSAAGVARLRRAIPADDPRLAIELTHLEARQHIAAGDVFGAERILLGTAAACRDLTWMMSCGAIDQELGDLYVRARRLDESEARLRAARRVFAQAGAPDLEDRTLRSMVNLQHLHNRDALATAYLEEMRRRAPDRCDNLRFVDAVGAGIALAAGDLATARARLPDPSRLCGKPPSAAILIAAVEIARIGEPGDRARAAALIEVARTAAGTPAVTAEIGEGRLTLETDPVRGAAQVRAGIAKVAALTSDPGNADELRAWAWASLIGDAARRGDWPGALAVFAEELGQPLPAGCLVAASLDDNRSTAIVRGRDGALRGSYQPGRTITLTHLETIVPPDAAAALAGCDAVAVIARPPLHGRVELLPPSLPWSFVSPRERAAPPPSGPVRHVIVSGALPPASLGLPPLTTVVEPGATLVTGGAATPSGVQAALGDASYIEIHAHGIVDVADAAFLALSPDADGRFALTAAELRTLALPRAPVVVLAACRSAVPGRYQGVRWSLPDAFLAAGARAVIASSTTIPDDQGAALFTELRARIDRGEPIAHAVAALRVARLAAGQPWAAGLIVFE